MTKRSPGLLVAAGLVVAGAAAAGSPAEDTTLAALLTEVRLLRQAMERSGVAAARIQLLSGRAALQEQRLAHARSQVENVEREALALGHEQSRQHQMLAEMEKMAESEGDPARRAGIEHELSQIRMQIRLHDARLDEARTRRTQLAQALDAERARHEEIEGRLDALERELERPAGR